MSSKYKVIYIVGGGHSGSTLMDMIIGSSSKVFSTGEIFYLDQFDKGYTRRTEQSTDGICSCSTELFNCEFWGDIKGDRSDRLIVHRTFVDSIKTVINLFNPISALLRFKVSIGPNKLVYDLAFEKAHKQSSEIQFLVDSSKDPRRLYELAVDNNINNDEILVIHLVRDVRGYVFSYQKKNRSIEGLSIRNAVVLSAEWLLINTVSKMMCWRFGFKSTRVSYDKFAENPEQTLSKINEFSGLDLNIETVIPNLNDREYHIVDGNRMKFKKIESIRYDRKWYTEMNVLKRFVLSVVFYPFNLIWVKRE